MEILVFSLFSSLELGSLSLLLPSLKGCCIVHAFCIIIMLIVNIKPKNLTPFFSLSNIATTPIINNNVAPLLLLSQGLMIYGATSFDQPNIYCNWHGNNAFETGMEVCGGGTINCGWGETTCPLPADCATCGGGKINKSSIAHLVAFKSKSYHRL